MTRRFVSRYGFLLSIFPISLFIFSAIMNQAEAYPQVQYIPPETIEVEMFALDPETYAPLGPCQLNDIRHGCGNGAHPFPNPTNYFTVDLEDEYLPYVVPEEMTPSSDHQALQAQAVAARTYALHLERFGTTTWQLDNTTRRQVFVPYSLKRTAETDQAILDTRGVYIACGDNCWAEHQGLPIFAEYSEEHPGSFTIASTDVGRESYLARVYDPVHSGSGTSAHGRGMSQQGARNWADGVAANGDHHPPWDYRRLLAHYYTAVDFEGMSFTIPITYRFNVLEFGNMDDRNDGNPLILRKGHEYYYPFIIQNTGDNDWNLYCNGGAYNVALGVHWYSYPGKQFIADTFEGSRSALCPPGGDGVTLPLKPGEEFPSQDDGADTDSAYIWVDDNLVADGDYWLRLDVDFHLVIWGSKLDPHTNPNNALWPTQDIHVLIAPQSVSPPAPALDNHTPGDWSNLPEVAVTWPAVDDAMGIAHYEYQWDSENWQITSNTSVSKTLGNGPHRFKVVAVANDGEESSTVQIEDILIDTISPTVSLMPLPGRVTTSTYSLTWSSDDNGGSGLKENQLRYQINGGAWSTISGVNDPGIQSVQFGFPGGQHGDIYTFCLKTLDNAGNESLESCTTTRYSPNPEFSITPKTIDRMRVYSDTTPLVETLQIQNVGGGVLNWTATAPSTWTLLGVDTGIAPSTVLVTVTHPLTIGVYTNVITFTGPSNTYNNPQVVKITINAVKEIHKQHLPIVFR